MPTRLSLSEEEAEHGTQREKRWATLPRSRSSKLNHLSVSVAVDQSTTINTPTASTFKSSLFRKKKSAGGGRISSSSSSSRGSTSSSSPLVSPSSAGASLSLSQSLDSFIDPSISNWQRRNIDFHRLFPRLHVWDLLIEDYACALQKDILIQGTLYISKYSFSFYSNIFGFVNQWVVPINDIIGLEKRFTLVFPNAIAIITKSRTLAMSSFIARDQTFDLMHKLWMEHKTYSQDNSQLILLPESSSACSDRTDPSPTSEYNGEDCDDDENEPVEEEGGKDKYDSDDYGEEMAQETVGITPQLLFPLNPEQDDEGLDMLATSSKDTLTIPQITLSPSSTSNVSSSTRRHNDTTSPRPSVHKISGNSAGRTALSLKSSRLATQHLPSNSPLSSDRLLIIAIVCTLILTVFSFQVLLKVNQLVQRFESEIRFEMEFK